jgi:hypothetical protein
MTLLDAKEFDPRPGQWLRRSIAGLLALIVVTWAIWFFFRYWPEEHAIDNFFQAIEQKNMEKAYAIYQADPDWKKHPEKYPNYPFTQFTNDWGASGEFGVITSHHVDCSIEPPSVDYTRASGVVVVVTINHTTRPKSMWVEKAAKTITESYIQAECRK